MLRDLHSGIGTTVNGRAVIDWVDLRDGDRIRLGLAEAGWCWARPQADEPEAPEAQPVPTSRSRQVFISHASEDKRQARALARWLEQRGWDAWPDECDIQGGSAWSASLQSAIRSSAVVVLLVSSNSVAKEWVMD